MRDRRASCASALIGAVIGIAMIWALFATAGNPTPPGPATVERATPCAREWSVTQRRDVCR